MSKDGGSNNGFVKFGPNNKPLFMINEQKGIVNAFAESLLYAIRMGGHIITPSLKKAAYELVAKKQKEHDAEIKSRGVPAKIRDLLLITSRKDAEKFGSKYEISLSDFSDFISNSSQINLSHSDKHVHFIPDHLVPTKKEVSAFSKSSPVDKDGKKFIRKALATFKQRRCISIHLFESSTDWYLFYFSYEDIFDQQGTEKSHWKLGTHIHYVRSTWVNYSSESAMVLFDKRKQSIPQNIHLKFTHKDIDEHNP